MRILFADEGRAVIEHNGELEIVSLGDPPQPRESYESRHRRIDPTAAITILIAGIWTAVCLVGFGYLVTLGTRWIASQLGW